MTEVISSIFLLALCGFWGICATVWHSRLKNEESIGTYFGLLIFYSMMNVFVVNLYRCYIWKAEELTCYANGDMMWLVDFGLCIISAFLCPVIFLVMMPKNIHCIKFKCQYMSMIGWGIIYCVIGVERYVIYQNVKSAIYDLLLPKHIVKGVGWLFVVLFIVYLKTRKVNVMETKECLANRVRRKIWMDTRSGKQRFKEAQLVVLLFVMTIWVYPFWETILSNGSEWYFSVGSIIVYSIAIYVLCYGILIFGFWIFHGKIWDGLLGIVFGSAIGAYLQTMFLNSDLFIMDGSKLQWSIQLLVGNFVIWMVVYGVIFAVYIFLSKYWKKMIQFLSFMLLCMQLVAIISLIPQYVSSEANAKVVMEEYLSTDGLYEVGGQDNIILFVLDCYDVDYLNEVLETENDFLQPLEGFTYYPDMISQFSRTWPSVTYMLTQEIYYRDMPYQEYLDKAFSECEFWTELEQKGYQYSIYEEEDAIALETRKAAKNYKEQGHSIEEQISFCGCLHAIMNVGHYRTMPYLWKNYHSYTAETINEYVIEKQVWDYPKYIADDAQIYAGLKENGLHIGEESKLFQFYHVTGAHPPYTLNEQGERVKESETTAVEQYKGCMQFVFMYLDELKRLNLYEDTMIIITADHGENYMTSRLEENTNPILFVKPAGVSVGELEVSDMYVVQGDILYTIAQNMGLKTSLEGVNLLDKFQDTSERIRYHYYDVIDGTKQMGIAPYEIKGTSLDFANWKETGEYIEFLIP